MGLVKRPRKLGKRTGRFEPLDTLSSRPASGDLIKQKIKSKRSVYIATVDASPPKERLIKKNEVAELLEGLDMDRMKQDTSKLVQRMDEIKKHSDNKDNMASKAVPAVSIDEPETMLHSMIDENVYGDSDRTSKVIEKYSAERPDWHPASLTEQEVVHATDKYLGLCRDIISTGDSHFYKIAKRISTQSNRPFITDLELINLPKGIYHGYLGPRRARIIADRLSNALKSEIRTSLRHKNRVVQYWQDYFTLYVLASEVIAHIIAEDQQVSLKEAYKEMEQTNDYGIYVMDKQELSK